MTMEELLPLMRAKIAELKIKPGAKLRVTEQPITLEVRETASQIFTSESFMCFSDRTLHEEVLA